MGVAIAIKICLYVKTPGESEMVNGYRSLIFGTQPPPPFLNQEIQASTHPCGIYLFNIPLCSCLGLGYSYEKYSAGFENTRN